MNNKFYSLSFLFVLVLLMGCNSESSKIQDMATLHMEDAIEEFLEKDVHIPKISNPKFSNDSICIYDVTIFTDNSSEAHIDYVEYIILKKDGRYFEVVNKGYDCVYNYVDHSYIDHYLLNDVTYEEALYAWSINSIRLRGRELGNGEFKGVNLPSPLKTGLWKMGKTKNIYKEDMDDYNLTLLAFGNYYYATEKTKLFPIKIEFDISEDQFLLRIYEDEKLPFKDSLSGLFRLKNGENILEVPIIGHWENDSKLPSRIYHSIRINIKKDSPISSYDIKEFLCEEKPLEGEIIFDNYNKIPIIFELITDGYNAATDLLAKQRVHVIEKLLKVNKDELDLIIKKDTTYKKTTTGIVYKIMKEGSGETPKPSDKINLIYKYISSDGDVFEEFKASNIRMYDNIFTEICAKLKIGGQADIYIPSYLAYKEKGVEYLGIGPNQVLHCQIELTSLNK